MDLRAGVERRHVGTLVLVLMLVVACSGADGSRCSAVGAAAVKGVGVLAVAAAAAASAGVCVVEVERAGSVDGAIAVPAMMYYRHCCCRNAGSAGCE